MKIKNFITLFFILSSICSCSHKPLIDKTIAIDKVGWKYSEKPIFKFTTTDSMVYYNTYLNIRIGANYRYSNIWLLFHFTAPNGEKQSIKRNFILADETGKWLGQGLGDLITFQLPFLEKQVITNLGNYTIQIEQNMRDEILKNVTDVGVMVKTGDKVF